MKNTARPRAFSVARVSTLAAFATASSASGAIISHDTGFTHEPSSSTFDWDIDGVGGRELGIESYIGAAKSLFGFSNGFGLATTNARLLNLAFGANVSTAAEGFEFTNITSVLNRGDFKQAQDFV